MVLTIHFYHIFDKIHDVWKLQRRRYKCYAIVF